MNAPAPIVQAHQLYCRLTGQKLRLDYVRQRQWYELLHEGFTLEEVRRVILYLQREIREGRRNVGALKLSNLLQPDRFEEDLNIRRVRLEPPPPPSPSYPMPRQAHLTRTRVGPKPSDNCSNSNAHSDKRPPSTRQNCSWQSTNQAENREPSSTNQDGISPTNYPATLHGHLFVFTNRHRNRVELLYWDGSGLWVCAKRLEKGRFTWPEGEGAAATLRSEELTALLGGLEVRSKAGWYRRQANGK